MDLTYFRNTDTSLIRLGTSAGSKKVDVGVLNGTPARFYLADVNVWSSLKLISLRYDLG